MLRLRCVLVSALTISMMLPVVSLSAANSGQSYKKFDALTSSESGGMTISSPVVAGSTTAVPIKTTTIEAPLPPRCKVGRTGLGGGIVFYVSRTKINVQRGISLGGRCLEVAPMTWAGTASDPTMQWGCSATSIVGTGIGIGTGASNTAKIMAGCATPGIAARSAANLTSGGRSDWFLPSRAELNLMYTNLYGAGVGGFARNVYWSSSEHNAYHAWYQYFFIGDQDALSKYRTFYVRPIRAFG